MAKRASRPAKKAVGKAKKGRALTYAGAGVDIDQKDAFTESLDATLKATFSKRVIENPGGFAGLLRLDSSKLFDRNWKQPVLVACCDGVGTKVKLAADMGKFDTVGQDLVAMNVNDLIVQNAEPLLFLDYIATPTIEKAFLGSLVKGIARACAASGCALLGGETAHMPDLYKKGDFDLAGFCVGVAELKRIQKQPKVQAGDVVIGLASDGVHSNGYTLVRKVVSERKLNLRKVYKELDPKRPLGEVLLTPTRLYPKPIVALMRDEKLSGHVSGMAHITGSGMDGNLCRALPKHLDALVDMNSWPLLPVFEFLQEHGNIPEREMRRVFNRGIGYTLIVRRNKADHVMARLAGLGERVYRIGEIVKGTGVVRETAESAV